MATYRLEIQLFKERLSEKVHATIQKGIVGGFESTVLQRNLQEWHERPWTYVCDCKKKASKVSSTATVSGTVYWSYPMLPFGIVACTFFRQPFSKKLYTTQLTDTPLFCLFQYTNIILLSSRWLDFSYCLEIIFNLWFYFLQHGNCFCHGWPLPRLLSNTTGHQVSKDLICNHGDLFLSMVRHRKLTNAHLTQQQTKAEHINLEEQKIFCKCVKKLS